LSAADACGAVSIASGFVVTGRHIAAARLAGAIRDIDPSCVKAYAVELEAWSELDRGTEVIAVWDAAKAGLGELSALAPLEGVVLDAQGKTKEFVERLEAAVAAGDHSPGTMKRILAFYVREDFYEAKAAEWRARVETHPEDEVASFFAGVLAHYAKDFQGSNALLKHSAKRFENEPRLYIYLAMNYFNLGDREATAKAIGHAEVLEVQDPDVFYCQGEIFRDTDRPRALRALRVYWHQTRWNTDANSSKQRRVWGLIEALERCIAEKTVGVCEGPWEHTFAAGKPSSP
jgi:tetratricopeptide (TPR) repeat protein